jgi:DNA-directed RNA polymerase subunit RPC12/RpoP
MSLLQRIPLDAITPVTPFAAPCVHSPLVQYHWQCPGCGAHVVSYWTEGATSDQIAADARCTRCRQHDDHEQS